MLTGGPARPAMFRGRELGAGTDLWQFANELRAGRMTQAEFAELEQASGASVGHCNEMGTASTMASIVEALGLSLPGSATIPAVDAARIRTAEATGACAVRLAEDGLTPSRILTQEAFDNAITLLMAIGGGTNAVVHLLAIAGRARVQLTLDRFHELSQRTPLIVNVRPGGEHLYEHLHNAGGVPAVLRELGDLVHGDALTVTGRTIREEVAGAQVHDRSVIAQRGAPRQPEGGIAVVRGSLAPDGALIKRSAASPELLRHRGRAVVFEDVYDVVARIDDPVLDVDADSVLVLRNSGPKGGPGMPEWGQVPIPKRLLERGVTDMVRISDARMSGTAFGTVVLHVAPESAAGGPLRAVRDGDPIVLDVEDQRLDLDLPAREIERRLAEVGSFEPRYGRGYGALYVEHVLQANEGCDFDFLRGRSEDGETEPLGLLSGWVGGW
jgi:dihydroxy-acid dehydratase